MYAWLAHDEVIDSIKFLTPNVNTTALQNALNAFPPHDTWHAKLLLAKTMGSVEALNYATSSLAIPFDASPLKLSPSLRKQRGRPNTLANSNHNQCSWTVPLISRFQKHR